MESWYIISSQPAFNSSFECEEFNNYVSDGFEELLTETQLGKKIYMCRGQFDGKNFETEIETEGIIQSETPDAYTQGWQRQLLTRISDKIQEYKYIRYDEKIWIIMTMPADNMIYNKCVLHLCNYTLKWQDNKGRIYYYPSNILDATQYNTGVENRGNVIQTGYIQLMAWLSLDETTAEIQRDKRMFIDVSNKQPATYIVTSTSKVPYSYNEMRVMRITFTECEFNPDTDRMDLLLCDYIEPVSADTHDIKIEYSGSPVIRAGGRKTFISDSKDTVFSLILSEMQKNKITMIQNKNICKISIVNDSLMVGTSFKLTVSDSNNRAGEVLIKIIGGV